MQNRMQNRMQGWTRRVRGALGTAVTWAVGWAIGGLAIGVASKLLPFLPWHWFFDTFDAPLPALAIPGFVAGLCFSLVLGFAARRHTLASLSLSRMAVWGALGGVMLTGVPIVMSAIGLAHLNVGAGALLVALGVPSVVFGSVSAMATLQIARRPKRIAGVTQ